MDKATDSQIAALLGAAFLSKEQIAIRLGILLSEVERVERDSEFPKHETEYED